MQANTYTRGRIPFFHDKTKLEFQEDVYERYNDMVVRQSVLHLADQLWGYYPFQPVIDYAEEYYPVESDLNVLEIGCGVGRWIASLATRYPQANCWGIDYSYQMLKRADEFWVQGQEVTIDWTHKGMDKISMRREAIENLNFGLAKAESLPFEANSQDFVVNSFLLDRLSDPRKGLEEMYRVLSPSGTMVAVSPLNFNQAQHWNLYYPSSKILSLLKEIGFEILDWKEDIIINEPVDKRGNCMRWKCLGFVLRK
jgi:ubiquinone/menaquinone biosynthesis C-methylase UbiE